LKEVSIHLPDKVMALSATPFALSGQTGLPFTGSLGSLSELHWQGQAGSLADSLFAGVRLATDASLQQLNLCYEIVSAGSTGEIISSAGTIILDCSDPALQCISLNPCEGELQDEEEAVLVLSANQNLMTGGQAAYLLNIYYNGSNLLSIPVSVTHDPDPPGFFDEPHLQNYPNPALERTVFAYAVPRDGHTQLAIYNLRGQKVRTLVSEIQAKGYYRLSWDLDSDSGGKVSSGIYFCRLKTASGTGKTIRFTVIR